MTAQVDAVACDVLWPDGAVVAARVDIPYANELLSKWEYRDCRKANFLYAASPDAVPVKALEGLVAKWRERDRRSRMIGGEPIFVEDCADELTQLTERSKELIKERSNG